jgi:hypothetical protein
MALLGLFSFRGRASASEASLADGEAEARRARSVALLQQENVPTITHLPVIETETESQRRSDGDVVKRAVALAIVAVRGETGDHALARGLVAQFGADGFFSPKERAFLDDPEPDQQQRVNFAWRYEGANVLLWALQVYGDLDRPDHICDVPKLASRLRDLGTDGLRRKARLLPQARLLDAADLIYRYDWAVVNARLKGETAPAGLDAGVVYERHYALNWLIGYQNQDWDDITTDT